jgi:hypothetical protein
MLPENSSALFIILVGSFIFALMTVPLAQIAQGFRDPEPEFQ